MKNFIFFVQSLKPSGSSGPSMTFALYKAFFGFLMMVYDRVGNGDKFSHKNFGFRKPLFYVKVS